jgi:hypothetical protein
MALLTRETMNAVLYGLLHTLVMLVALTLLFGLDFGRADPITPKRAGKLKRVGS